MKLPKNIAYITNNKDKITTTWEDDEDNVISSEDVLPTFVADAANPKTIETGKRWAEHQQYWAEDKTPKVSTIDIVPNEPMSGVRLITLEYRRNGGRAYKVVLPGGYYVDLREDIMIDLATKASINKGILGGEYVWVSRPGGMTLVRVGSYIHNKVLEEIKMEETRKEIHSKGMFKKQSLVPNTVYKTHQGEIYLFLGFINYYSFNGGHKCGDEEHAKLVKKMPYYVRITTDKSLDKTIENVTKALNTDSADIKHISVYTKGEYISVEFDMAESRHLKFIEEVRKVEIKEGVIERIRKENMKLFLKEIEAEKATKLNSLSSWDRSYYENRRIENKRYRIQNYLLRVTMVPHTEIVTIPEEMVKYSLGILQQ